MGVPPESSQARNLLADGDTFPSGQQVRRARGRLSWDELVTRRDPETARRDRRLERDRSPWRRRGMAVVPLCFGIAFTSTTLNQASALVHVHHDGSVNVSTGAVEISGVAGKIRAVVACTLGIDERLVRVEPTSTSRIANMSPTAARVRLNGSAAREACLTILAGLPELAPGAPWSQRVGAAYATRRPLSALAHFATPGLQQLDATGHARRSAARQARAALIEAAWSTCSGCPGRGFRPRHHRARHRAQHRPADQRGQVEGAVVQGIGWMTTEEVVRDASGRLLSDLLAMPRCRPARRARA